MANNIRFDLRVSGGAAASKQFRSLAKDIGTFTAAVTASQKALKTSFIKGIAQANQFTIQFVAATRKQINAEAERARQAGVTQRLILRQREREKRDREKAAAEAIRGAHKEAEARHRILVRAARRARASLARENTDRKRALAARVKQASAAAAAATKAEAAALAKRLSQQKAFFGRLAGLATTANAAVIRALGSIGLSGPAFRGVFTSVGKTFEKLGTDGGKSFVGGLVKTIVRGLASIPKLVGDIAGPLLQAFGSILKALGASIPALAATIGAVLGAALAPFSAGLSAIIPVVTTGMGLLLGIFVGAIGGLAQAFGGLVTGIGNAMSSILSVVGDALASVTDLLVGIGEQVFSAISGIVTATLGAITGGIQKVFGALTGLAGKAIKTLLSPATLLVTALSIKATKDINDKIIDAFALLDDRSDFHLGNVRSSIFELSRAVGVSSNEIATLLFDVISAGFRETAEAFEILQRAAELAVAGSASVAASGEAIVSSLIAQKRGAEDSAQAMRFLFAMQDRGRVTVEDAAEAVAGLSASMISARVPAEELAGAFAALSLQGIPAAAVTTQLRELILNLAAPTPLAAAAMKSLGIEIHKLTDDDRRFLTGLRENIEAQETRLAATDKGTAAFRSQRAELTRLKQELGTQERVKGQFVGIQQAIITISKALAEGGDEAIRFARVIVPRKRARDALAFLAQNVALLVEKIRQATEDFGKFDTALIESQQKVGVQLTKTVTALRQLGVEIYTLGTTVTGGRGFELVRAAIDRVRGGIVALQGIIPGLRDDFLSIAGSIREAFRPITDLGLVGIVKRVASLIVTTLRGAFNFIGIDISKFVDTAGTAFEQIGEFARTAFDIAIGAANEFAEVFAGTLSFQDSAVGALLNAAGTRLEQLFVNLKLKFFDFRDVAVGALGRAFLSIRELLVSVVQLFATTVEKVIAGLPSGMALVPLFLFGPDDVDVSGFMKKILREVDAAASGFATKGMVLTGADFDIETSPLAASIEDIQSAAQDAASEINVLRAELFGLSVLQENILSGQKALTALDLVPMVGGFAGDLIDMAQSFGPDLLAKKWKAELKEAIELEKELTALADKLIEKKNELTELQKERVAATNEERESAKARKEELKEEIALENQLLLDAIEGLKLRGEARKEDAALNAERRRVAGEMAALQKEAIRDAQEVSRFESRRIALAKELGLESTIQEKKLERILSSIEKIAGGELTAEERADALNVQFERMVLLSAGVGINVEELAAKLDRAGKGIGNLQGIGGLTPPTGTPFGAPALSGNIIPILDAIIGVTQEGTKQTIAGFDGGVDDLRRFLGQGLTVSFAPKSASLLERLAAGTKLEQGIAKAFRAFGQPKPGVGGFVAQAQLERGEGFLPLEGLPKELIESFETTLGPNAPVVTRLETLIDSIDELRFARRTGDLPGQRLGAPQGFQVSGAGEVIGVRPDALSSDLVQKVLQGIASRETVVELLDSLGLQLNSLDGIKKILLDQLQIERGLGGVSPRDLPAAERDLSRGQAAAAAGGAAAFGPGRISIADTKKLVQLQQALSEARDAEGISTLQQQVALAKLQQTIDSYTFGLTKNSSTLKDIFAAQKAYDDALAKSGESTTKTKEKSDEFSDILDGTSGAATSATKAFAGLESILEVFAQLDLEKTGKSLAEFAKELGADKPLQRLLEKAEKEPEGAEADVVERAKGKKALEDEAAKDPAVAALENLEEAGEGWVDFTTKVQENTDSTKTKVEELGTQLDTTGGNTELFKEKVADLGLAALEAFPFLGSLVEQIRLLRDAGAEVEAAELGTEAEATRAKLEELMRQAREKEKDVAKVGEAKAGEKEKAGAKSAGEKAVLEALKAAEEAARQSEEILAERSKSMAEATDIFRTSMKAVVSAITLGFDTIQNAFFEVRSSFEEMTTQITEVTVPAVEQHAEETTGFAEQATVALETMSQTLEAHTTALVSLSARVTALGG